MGIVLSGVFLPNSVEKHDNMQIIKGLLLVESTIKFAGPLQGNRRGTTLGSIGAYHARIEQLAEF